MNWIPIVIKGLEYAAEHPDQIKKDVDLAVSGIELGIHVIRRIEHLCVHHNATPDEVLVHADKGLSDKKSEDKS